MKITFRLSRCFSVSLIAFVLLFGLTLTAAEAAPATWPDTNIWPNTSSSDTFAYKMLVSGTPTPVRDVNGDQNPDSTDVSSHGANNQVGDWNSVYFYATSTHLFFRMLLNDNPAGPPGSWAQYSWLVEIDVNGDSVTDWRVGIAGVDELVYATCLSTSQSTTRSANPANGYTRQISTDVTGPSSNKTMYYADWQIELSALNDGAGGCPDVSTSTPIRLFYGTSANGQVGGPVNKDFFTGSSVDYTNMTYVSASEPMAVALAFLTATTSGNGVTLSWETVSEQDNAGFNVYRAPGSDDFSRPASPWTKLNDALIPAATPGSSEGNAYTWTDTSAEPGATYWYMLEDVALDGTATQHPPVQVTVAEPNAVGLAGPLVVTASLAWPPGQAAVTPFVVTASAVTPFVVMALAVPLALAALAGAGLRRRRG